MSTGNTGLSGAETAVILTPSAGEINTKHLSQLDLTYQHSTSTDVLSPYHTLHLCRYTQVYSNKYSYCLQICQLHSSFSLIDLPIWASPTFNTTVLICFLVNLLHSYSTIGSLSSCEIAGSLQGGSEVGVGQRVD